MPRHPASPTRPDHPDRGSVQVESHEAVERKVSFTNTIVRAVDLAVQCQDEGHRMFGDGIGGVCRHTDDGDAQFFCSVKINIVESCTPEGNVLDTDV